MATNPVKQSPTATIGALATATMTVLTALVAHGVIPAGVAKTYGPWIVLVVVAASFLLTWLHVSPWAKVQDMAVALEDGRLPDADLARIEAVVGELLHGEEWLTGHATGTTHPDAVPAAHPDAAQVEATAGMSAGAPSAPQSTN